MAAGAGDPVGSAGSTVGRPQAVPEPPGAEKPHSEMDSRKHLLEAALGKRPEPQLSPGCRQPSPLPSPAAAWGQPSARSSGQQGLQTQDWVCEPRQSRYPSRRWSVSIDERRRLALLGGWERPRAAGGPQSCQDITQIVAQLVSEDVDKDVLLPHPPRSAESTNGFHAFLAPSAPFWQNATLEAQGSRSPPS
ncbi:testis-expressed protein 22 isoform X1 [Equus przewalskii]|uniref:Testis-expressed protein 22 isoform X1 n=2 Tax=Equus przewalskii TaxID=9798 RepID=A0ABM4M8T9_EQUPR